LQNNRLDNTFILCFISMIVCKKMPGRLVLV